MVTNNSKEKAMYKKLEVVLNKAFPKKSGIKLKVYPVISESGNYNVQIYKNGKACEQFGIPENIVHRLVG